MELDLSLATPQELSLELGARVRAQRLSQLLSQAELALRAGVSTGALKKLERDGQANMLTFMRTVTALGLAKDLEPLLALKPQTSIAEMEKAQQARRKRAPRRRAA